MATLTSANAVFLLGIAGIYTTAQQLQGWDSDDAFMTAAVKPGQTKMGIDGFLSGGWVPTAKPQVITLQADSASNDIFDIWAQTQEAAQELSIAFGIIILPGLGKKFACTRGILTDYIPVPNVKLLTQPRKFEITWNSILPSPV